MKLSALLILSKTVLFFLCFQTAHAAFCPTPENIRENGVPKGFEHDSTYTAYEDHKKVYGFDTALLHQESAIINNEQTATADSLICRYEANNYDEVTHSMPFYIIRTVSSDETSKIKVKFDDPGWRGFCWGPEDEDVGCVVVCHFHIEHCPFQRL